MKKIHFKTINSTNTYLKENYKDLPNFTCVSSAHQSQGHGRYNRSWESNNNENLMFSILIKNKKLIEKFSSISLAIATCILKMLTSYKIKNISIKWPNDVYVNDKKICGILLEGIANECLIIGVGLNVNQTNFSKEIEDKTKHYNKIKLNVCIGYNSTEEINHVRCEYMKHKEHKCSGNRPARRRIPTIWSRIK